jgi:hypothetical protein
MTEARGLREYAGRLGSLEVESQKRLKGGPAAVGGSKQN